MAYIDLNSDLGESFGAYKLGCDEEVIKYVTAANIACGWHAGDPLVMTKTVKMAKEHGVDVGAHPGFPDLMGFGRRTMAVSPEDLKAYIKYQIGALSAFAKAENVPVHHMVPHGAISQFREDWAHAICEAVGEVDDRIIIYAIAGSALEKAARAAGLPVASEIFADRAYMDDLSLAPRNLPGAMITDEDEAISRCIRMVKEGVVTGLSGKELEIRGETLCVHGDGPKALEFVRRIREAFREEGIEVKGIR